MTMLIFFLFALSTDQFLSADTPKCNSLEIEGRQLIRTKKVRSCNQDLDCTMYTQCPLGCYRPINRNAVQHLEKFMNSYRMSCSRCIYECVAKVYDEGKTPPEVKCISNLCEWTDELQDTLVQAALSPEFSELYVRWRRDGLESLNDVERFRIVDWEIARIFRIESQYIQWERGVLKEQFLAENVRIIIKRSVEGWRELDILWVAEGNFREEIDQALEEIDDAK